MKNFLAIGLMISLFFSCKVQDKNKDVSSISIEKTSSKKPRLIVGIVVDQMRYDYLTRFESKFGTGGFKRMIREGFNCKNNHFNYVPTYTGPGHASVYTGTTPKYHGIISNNWYSRVQKSSVYCVQDDAVESVGTKSKAGKMSPNRMLTTSFADENRLLLKCVVKLSVLLLRIVVPFYLQDILRIQRIGFMERMKVFGSQVRFTELICQNG